MLKEAANERFPALVGVVEKCDLVHSRAQLWPFRINGRDQVSQPTQTFDIFLPRIGFRLQRSRSGAGLLERDRLPVAGVAWPHPLERTQHTIWGINLLQSRIASCAGRGASIETLALVTRNRDEACQRTDVLIGR